MTSHEPHRRHDEHDGNDAASAAWDTAPTAPDAAPIEQHTASEEPSGPAEAYPATHRHETEPITGPAPAWGAPAEQWERARDGQRDRRAGRSWGARRTAATAAIALAVTGGAAAAAYGLSGAASSAGQSAQAGPGGTDGMQGAPGDGAQEGTGQDSAGQGSAGQGQGSAGQEGAAAGGGQAGGAPGSAGTGADAAGLGSAGGQPLYSTSVVEQDGKYVTVVSQTGTVQRISADSVTVESADGHTQTYAVSEDSLVEGFSTGDEVRAAGTRDGEDVTLTTLAQAAQSGTQSGTGRSEEDGADTSQGTGQDADQSS